MVTIKRETLNSLKERWNDFVAKNATMQPYQEWEMVKIIKKYYLPFMITEKEWSVFYSFNEDGETIAIAPMARRFGDKIPYVNFGKAPTVAVKDFIYPSDLPLSKMKECLNLLKKKLGAIRFYDVPEYSLLFKALEDIGERCKDHVYTTIPFNVGGGNLKTITNLYPSM